MELDEATTPDVTEGDSTSPRDYDAEARGHGWTPLEDFKGDPARWVDAETFVKRADEVMPFLKKQNAGLKREIDSLKSTIKQASAFYSKAEERAYNRAMADLQARHDEAMESGDVAAGRRVLKEIRDLDAEVAASAPANVGETDEPPADAQQRIRAWIEESPWYFADETKTKYADIQSDDIVKEYGALHKFPGGLDAALAEIDKRVSRKFAEKKASPVSGGGNRSAPSGGGRTFADLPPQAKAMCDRFVKQGIIPNREAYVKDFDWS